MDTAGQAVELGFTMTAADLRHGAHARRKATFGGRVRLVLPYVTAILGTLTLAAGIALARSGPALYGNAAVVIMLSIVGLVVVGAQQLANWRFWRRLAELTGNVRASIDDTCVRIANDDSASVNNWSAYGSFVETDRAFVLLSPDKRRIAFTVLPKRGLVQPTDAERLRAILVRNLT